jgi:hypothetical protein
MALFCVRREFKIESEKAGEDFVVGEIEGPAVGGGEGGIEALVGAVEPGGADVVEVGERALGELLCALFVLGNESK